MDEAAIGNDKASCPIHFVDPCVIFVCYSTLMHWCVFDMYRRRELKLKENAATSRIRSVATAASRIGTSRRSDAPRLAILPARYDVIHGLLRPRGEQVRALAECER